MKKLFIILLAGLIGSFAFAEKVVVESGKKSFAPLKFTHNESNWNIYISDFQPVAENKVKVTYAYEKDTKQVTYVFTVGNEYELGYETNLFVMSGKYRLESFDDNEIVFEITQKEDMVFF